MLGEVELARVDGHSLRLFAGGYFTFGVGFRCGTGWGTADRGTMSFVIDDEQVVRIELDVG